MLIKLITGNFVFSDNSDVGWSEKHKQNEIHDRKMITNEMNEANVSLAVSSRDSHIIPNLECQKITQDCPPDIFNNSSSLKYLHKKFKRVASTVIEDDCVKISTNVNKTYLAECASKFDATILNNINGEAFSAAAAAAAAAAVITQSHINKPETNNSHVIEKYSELTNVPAKRDQNLVNNESVSKRNVVGVDLSGNVCGLPKENVQQSHKIHATDFSDGINKCKNDGSLRGSTNTQNHCESLPEDFRTKTKTSIGLENIDENLVRNAQYNLSVQSANISVNSKSACSSSNIESGRASVTRKLSARRKNNDRPYQCATCGIELKSKSQLYKHCRFVSSFWFLLFVFSNTYYLYPSSSILF